MVDQPLKSEKAPVQPRSWCVEWFRSQGDSIAGRVKEPIPLDRFAGLESLYAVGSVELARGEVSIFDSVPLIAEVQNGHARVSVDFCRRAAFLVYEIVENWRGTTVRVPIEDEQRFEEFAVLRRRKRYRRRPALSLLGPLPSGLGHVHVLCNQRAGEYNPELHEPKPIF
jgi:hypothetical protein